MNMNLRAMVKYGMTPYEAMVTATRAIGEFLEEPIGVLRPGYLADLVVLDGNPLQNVNDAAAVRIVMINGVAHTVEDLLAPFASASAQVPQSTMLPSAPAPAANQDYWWHDPHYIESGRRSCCVAD
jgi:adenine deaminase